LRDLERDDISRLNAVKPDSWSDISAVHEHYLSVPNCRCVKAVDASPGLAGIGTGIAFSGTGWLAHIIVSKDHRRRGLGTMIVEDRIQCLRERMGCGPITLTATDDGYPLYRKIGFVDESLYAIFAKPGGRVYGDIENTRIVRVGGRYLDGALAIDRITSGEDRASFLRPLLKNGYAYVADGAVTGFYLPGFGDGGVSALTEEAGLALLGIRIREEKAIYLPEENAAGRDFLLAKGYSEVRRIHRMILGSPFAREPSNCYSRLGGFAG
jgi:GNAT superfamily N-acetyltransferase